MDDTNSQVQKNGFDGTPGQVISGVDKELGPGIMVGSEQVFRSEAEKTSELPLEVQEFVEKTEAQQEFEKEQPVVHEHKAPGAMGSVKGSRTQLPLSRQGIVAGLQAPIDKAWRWLATLCIRIIDKVKGRVIYSSEPHSQQFK